MRLKLYSCVSFLLLVCGPESIAQIWQRLYGGINQEISLIAFPSPSGTSIYYLGATTSAGSGDADPALMKLDLDGQIIWAKTIGGVYHDVANAMVQAADGGLVCAGSSKSFNGNVTDDLYFFKVDSMGDVVWSKTFSEGDLDIASAVLRTADGGYAITGYSRIGGVKRVLLIRTDANGDTLYTRNYGGTADDQGVELHETSDGGFLITGKAFTQSLGESDILLMRTDPQGNLVWAKSFGDTLWDEGAGIIILQDGNFLISGSTISFGQGDFDILLLKTDSSGNLMWGRTYGGDETDASYTARENADGSIVLSGYSNSMGYAQDLRLASGNEFQNGGRGDDSTNLFLIKVDADGDTLWTRTFGDGAQDEAFHFSKMSDGGYLLPGFSTSYTNTTDSTQMMLIRTDSLGYSGCHEQDARPILDTTNFITQVLGYMQGGGMTVSNVTSISLNWNEAAEDACLYIGIGEPGISHVDVFPNPAVNHITILSDSELKKIELLNLLGERIMDCMPAATEATISTESIPPGIYIAFIQTENGSVTRKIIIQKY